MEKNPIDGYMDSSLAAIFSMMLPGLGQMLMEKVIPGIFWAVAVGGGYLVNGWCGLSLHVICILDAAFHGGLTTFLRNSDWIKRTSFIMGLSALLIYTCLRTGLF